ncbi:MAG: helix-turn-helix transcriptional regulator [Bacteroidetes bacterium]|nr:helix-turn-helix transcriptional regulator [Bacteroidota bacterium]
MTNRTREIVGILIKSRRLKIGITQKELGDLLGTDKQYVWNIENGRINITLDYLEKIIRVLKCSPKDFFNID